MTTGSAADRKSALRRDFLARRRVRSEADRAVARARNTAHLSGYLRGRRPGMAVCGYLPLPSEPLDPALLDRLAADGRPVLVPVATRDQPLDWIGYPCETVPGPFGIREPVGRRLGASAIGSAGVILVPALAVDARGVRMGRGGGHYDRSLALADLERVALIAVLYDDEVVDELPREPHDLPVTAVVTPSGGVRPPGAR